MVQNVHRTRNVRVLLVEDNVGDACLTLEAFKETGFPLQLVRVSDGEEAMAYLERKQPYQDAPPPDLILLDLNMPRRDGYWVLSRIRKDPRFASIPVVVLTCSRNADDIRRAYEEQANFYMVKPSDLEELFQSVRYLEEVWLSPLRFEAV